MSHLFPESILIQALLAVAMHVLIILLLNQQSKVVLEPIPLDKTTKVIKSYLVIKTTHNTNKPIEGSKEIQNSQQLINSKIQKNEISAKEVKPTKKINTNSIKTNETQSDKQATIAPTIKSKAHMLTKNKPKLNYRSIIKNTLKKTEDNWLNKVKIKANSSHNLPSLLTKSKTHKIKKTFNKTAKKDTFIMTDLGNGNKMIQQGTNCFSTSTSTLPNGDTMTLWGFGGQCNNKGTYQEQLNKSLEKYLH